MADGSGKVRKEYLFGELTEDTVDPDPLRQFAVWLDAAHAAQLIEANAMTVATATPDGIPSARTVLLKGFDERGFVFYTNYASQKGDELAANPVAALLFYWPALERQVRISGHVERTSPAESERYFAGRPPGARISAALSPQSRVIPSRAWLAERFAAAEVAGDEIALPENWGGYRVMPEQFEFWQGRPNRLHDRLRYRRDDDGAWAIERLAP